MKTTILTISALVCLVYGNPSKERSRRDPVVSSYSYSGGGSRYGALSVPLQETHLYSLGIDSFLPFAEGSNTISEVKANIVPVALSNSVEKPIQEASDPAPQPATGAAIIPLRPPPAVPVNAAAANVPANNGAVFLGSGALGVVNLGNGAFALGSGGIGYSDIRQQPRPNGRSPLFPPLPANPSLVPAARPSQQAAPIPQADLTAQLSPNGFQFSNPLFMPTMSQRQTDQNGYERLQTAGFGSPSTIVRRVKTRVNYATPTVPQLTVEAGVNSQLPQPGFGEPIPRLPPQALRYV